MRRTPDHPNLLAHDHPLIGHKLGILRDASTPPPTFRRVLGEIAGLMTYEALRDLPTKACRVRTPIDDCDATELAAPVTIVPILRAGLGMTDGMLRLVPEARVGHIGVQRNEETHQPIEYYEKLPADIADGPVLVVDPMLATGGSATYAVKYLKKRGCGTIRFPLPGGGARRGSTDGRGSSRGRGARRRAGRSTQRTCLHRSRSGATPAIGSSAPSDIQAAPRPGIARFCGLPFESGAKPRNRRSSPHGRTEEHRIRSPRGLRDPARRDSDTTRVRRRDAGRRHPTAR